MSNGVIRRVDGLGRIVIPIHMRKKLMINENDNVEIYMGEDNHIIMEKYSTLKGSGEFFQNIAISLYESIGGTIIITDQEVVLASYGEKRMSYAPGIAIDNQLITAQKAKTYSQKNSLMIKFGQEEIENIGVFPIVLLDKSIGSIVFVRSGALSESEIQMLKTFASLIGNMMKG